MAYLVEFSACAIHDLEVLYVEKDAAESPAAARWYNGLEEAVDALRWYPHRDPLAPEARKLKRKLRQLLYGKKPNVYRVVYELDEERQTVWVLTIRHGARQTLRRSDLVWTERFYSACADLSLTYSQNRTNVADLPIHISNCSTARGGPHVEHFEFRNSPQTSSLH